MSEKVKDGATRVVCAVTGANGYVGSRIASALTADCDVVPMGRNAGEGGIRWTFDSASVMGEMRLRRVTALVHSAWDFRYPKANENWEANVKGSQRLIESALSAGCERIVFVSSMSAFEGARSEYGKSKLAVERLVLEAGGAVIRPGLVWGNRPGGMFLSLKQQVSKGGWVPMIGNGRYPQYLVHEDDLGEAVRRAVHPATANKFAGRVLTLAHPQSWLLRDLILGIAKKEGRTVKLLGVPWRLVYGALKIAETLGIKMGFRSDSLIGLVYHTRTPQFSGEFELRSFVVPGTYGGGGET